MPIIKLPKDTEISINGQKIMEKTENEIKGTDDGSSALLIRGPKEEGPSNENVVNMKKEKPWTKEDVLKEIEDFHTDREFVYTHTTYRGVNLEELDKKDIIRLLNVLDMYDTIFELEFHGHFDREVDEFDGEENEQR